MNKITILKKWYNRMGELKQSRQFYSHANDEEGMFDLIRWFLLLYGLR